MGSEAGLGSFVPSGRGCRQRWRDPSTTAYFNHRQGRSRVTKLYFLLPYLISCCDDMVILFAPSCFYSITSHHMTMLFQ